LDLGLSKARKTIRQNEHDSDNDHGKSDETQ